jgi:hypothetical protein
LLSTLNKDAVTWMPLFSRSPPGSAGARLPPGKLIRCLSAW